MNKQTAVFAVWMMLCTQVLPAQQGGAPQPQGRPAQTPGWGMSGVKGWLGALLPAGHGPDHPAQLHAARFAACAGRLYLSLQDSIALAMENNLDIEIQRYGPRLADTAAMRAEAGGFIRGIPTTLNTTTTNVANQVSGLGGLGSSVGRGGGTGGGTDTQSAGGFVFQQTGTTIPILDPVVSMGYGFFHRTTINSNSFATGVPAFSVRNNSPYFSLQKGFLYGTNVSLDMNTSYVNSSVPRAEINPFYTNAGIHDQPESAARIRSGRQ